MWWLIKYALLDRESRCIDFLPFNTCWWLFIWINTTQRLIEGLSIVAMPGQPRFFICFAWRFASEIIVVRWVGSSSSVILARYIACTTLIQILSFKLDFESNSVLFHHFHYLFPLLFNILEIFILILHTRLWVHIFGQGQSWCSSRSCCFLIVIPKKYWALISRIWFEILFDWQILSMRPFEVLISSRNRCVQPL